MQRRDGQSLVEYVVLLALIAMVAVIIVAGVGQSSSARVAEANGALQGSDGVVATHTGGTGTTGKGGAAGAGAGAGAGHGPTKNSLF